MPDDHDLEQIAAVAGTTFARSGDTVSFGRTSIHHYSDSDQWFDPALKDLIPRKARGDYRERTVNLLVRDAVANPGDVYEDKLFGTAEEVGAFSSYAAVARPETRSKFGDVLKDHYVVVQTRTTRFLFPFQTDLPGNFRFRGRYKLFTGIILAFLAKPGDRDGFNEELLTHFYELFNGTGGLSLLDQHALRIAREVASASGKATGLVATTAQLLDGSRQGGEPTYRAELEGEPFFPEVHALIQADLLRALSIRSLGRKDKVNAVLTVFYVHLALYYWRAAYILEEQAQGFLRTLAGVPGARDELAAASNDTLIGSAFRGKLKFRVSTARPRPVKATDPAAEAYREINNARLRLLPVNISLLSAARKLTNTSAPASFSEIASSLEQEPNASNEFDAACRAAALAIADKLADEQRADIRIAAASQHEPGLSALRSAIIKRWKSDLRRSSTDITAGLMTRGGRGIFATRGNVPYFEVGQDLLLLLTKLIAGDDAIRYRDFLNRLADYGLSPQTRDEEAVLADVLRSLQLLEKFSDTGEAMYVKHFL